MSDTDPQANAEQIDEDELPGDTAPDEFIEPEDWDAGAGSSEDDERRGEDAYNESEVGQERQAPLNAEDAAMHIEPGNATN